MICILSQAYCEESTENVMDWLRYLGGAHVRINTNDLLAVEVKIDRNAQTTIQLTPLPFEPSEVTAVWHRKWSLTSLPQEPRVFSSIEDATFTNLCGTYLHFRTEIATLSRFLFKQLNGAEWIGHPFQANLNKLEVLAQAKDLGIDVPATLITSRVEDAEAFRKLHGRIICKPLSEVLLCERHGTVHMTYTAPFDEASAWAGGFPSLFQERLEKLFEIRVFVLDDKFYSAAIFSQAEEATRHDFRVYQAGRPTRTVPFLLDAVLSEQLGALMTTIGLRTGSIDLVRTSDGRTVFLEINPVGQFEMVAGPCNYPINRDIALALSRGAMGEHQVSF